MTGSREKWKKWISSRWNDSLNAFHCFFRGSTLSLPAPPLQVTPPRKRCHRPPCDPSGTSRLSTLLYPLTPNPTAPGPPTALTPPTEQSASLSPKRTRTHTHTHTHTHTLFWFQRTGLHLSSRCRRHCWCVVNRMEKYLLLHFLY